MSERVQALTRVGDTFARLGGDEFAIIQVGLVQLDDVASLAQRIIDALAQPFELHGHETVIGCSIGIAVDPDGRTQADLLLRNADLALYRAKAEGRSNYCFFEEDMNVRLQQRKTLEAALRRALAHEEFEVHYQPQIGLGDQRVTGVEALIRWRHPERGTIPPDEFVPLAGRDGHYRSHD